MQKKEVHLHSCRVKFTIFVLMLFLFVGSVQAGNDDDYKNTKITLKVDNMRLDKVLDSLAVMVKVQFFYNHAQINVQKEISIDVKNRTLDYVLLMILGDQPVDVEYQMNRVIVLKPRPKVDPRSLIHKVSGVVIDASTKDPLPGASIVLKERVAMGVVTDINGKFFIEVPEGISALLVSFVGYENEEIPLTGKLTDLEIKLTPKQEELEDVVVTGMAPRKVESFSGSYVSVKGSELKKLNPTNILKALQVFDPSFRIVENNKVGSDPNAMPEFRLRGDVQLNPTGANDLQMLMGDYSNRPNMPLFILDGFKTTLQRIVDLDPERIESVTILKDASATAIYGSEAANGVLVFETKKPLSGALNVSYSMNLGVTTPDLSDYNLMNAEEKLEYEKRAGLFNPLSASDMNYYNYYKQEILRGVNTYWLSKPLQTPITHRHTLSMEGGDEALMYSLSVNYSSEPGVMKESDRTSMGLSLNLQYRRKKWNINNQLSLSNVKGNNSPYGSFSEYTKLNPYYRVKDENGHYTKLIEYKSMGAGTQREEITNPLYNIQFPYKDMTENFSVTDNFAIECAIQENLRVNVAASFTKGTARSEVFKSMNHTDFAGEKDLTKRGSYNKNTGETFTWSLNASVNYNLTFGKHLISLFGRWNVDENQGNSVNLSAKGFPNDNMTDFLFGFEMDNRVAGMESTSRSVGVIGQVSYMYDTRYSMDFSIRGDLSSQFGSNTGMAPFWSIGARWNMHKEKWLENTFISNLVLRGSYGVTGSQSYEPYQATEMYSFRELMFPYPATDVLGAQLKGIGNPDLGWSKTKNRSVALELGFFQNRLNFGASYYNNLTENLLLDYTLAPSVGFRTMTTNVGAVKNEGIDLQLNGLIINDWERNIQWTLGINGAHNRNVVEKISNVLKALNETNLASKDEPLPIYEEGKSMNQLFTVRSLGIDPATGKEVYLKRNGEKTFVWDAVDKVPMGDSQPKWNGSISSSFLYKNWSMNLAFTYSLGAHIYNQTLVDKIENSKVAYNLDRRAIKARWSKDNPDAKYKSIEIIGNDTPQSSRFVQKENKLTFSSITLGYRFDPKNFKFLQTCRVASLSLNATMNDIAVLSTIRQERGLDYPFARSFNLSLSVLFN